MIYKDITSILPDETDFFGNVTINSIALYLKKGESNTTITSIEFVAADILDVSTISNINFTDGATENVTLSTASDGIKKTLSFKQIGSSDDMYIKTSNINTLINRSDMFFVVESNLNTLNDKKLKLRDFTTSDDNIKWEGSSTSATLKEIGGKQVYIMSVYNNNSVTQNSVRGVKELMTEVWYTTPTKNIKEYTLYIKNVKDTEVKIYRMGFYNFSEILQMYPSLASEKWWFMKTEEGHCCMEVHDAALENEIKVNNGYGTANTNTTAYAAQLVRSLGGALPSNFKTIYLDGKFSFKTDEIPCSEDIFAGFPATITKIQLGESEISYMPTTNQNVFFKKDNVTKYYAFKEGSATVPENKGDGSNWSSLTRTFKAGYNSLCVPFNKLQVKMLPAGISVYQLSGYENGEVTFSKVTENVSNDEKKWPYIIHAEQAGTYVLLGRDPETENLSGYSYKSAGTNSEARLVGSFVEEVPSGEYASRVNYGIDNNGKLAKMGTSTKTTYYRAFLSLPADASVRDINFEDDEVTGINAIKAASDKGIYNLQGVRMSGDNLPRGIYVRDGKKFAVK